MDKTETPGGFGDGGDPGEQFHRNEAISAVADDGLLGEEEEDDYEDLYNDVNVGEGFLQSFRKNEDSAVRNDEEEKKVVPLPPPLIAQAAAEPGPSIAGVVSDVAGSERKFEKDDGGSNVSDRVEGHQNLGYRANEPVGRASGCASGLPVGGGFRVELAQPGIVAGLEEQSSNVSALNQGIVQQSHATCGPVGNTGIIANAGNDGLVRQGGGNINGPGGNGFGNGSATGGGGVGSGYGFRGGGGGGGGGTILFVGDLHWWTTDAELESELCKYGPLKEVKFFDEKASGKSKGYCQVEFYDSASVTACKEGMNGHVFNGRPCVVAYASPYSVKRMGEAQVNRNQQQMAQANTAQPRRGPGDAPVRPGSANVAPSGNFQGGGDNNRNFGRGNWGRGNAQGMGNRGPLGPIRGRVGGMGGRGLMGNGGNGFGQGIGGTPPLLHPQAMMGQGFDPGFGGPMGRMGNYGGFPGGPAPPFSGMMSSFPPVGNVGLPGVAPHVNPAFFGRGMPMNGMGMMPTTGVDGHGMGRWPDSNMSGWAGEEHGGRGGESSYGEEAVSDHQYGEHSHDRGGWPKEKDRGSERDWSGTSDTRYRDDREPGYDRDMPREKDMGRDHEWSERRHSVDRDIGREQDRERDRDRDRERSRDREREHERDCDMERDRDRYRDGRDRYVDHHRYRDYEPVYEDELDRARSSRSHKSRLPQEEHRRSRSRDAEYGKRQRLTSE